jgi:hypothetical protein
VTGKQLRPTLFRVLSELFATPSLFGKSEW